MMGYIEISWDGMEYHGIHTLHIYIYGIAGSIVKRWRHIAQFFGDATSYINPSGFTAPLDRGSHHGTTIAYHGRWPWNTWVEKGHSKHPLVNQSGSSLSKNVLIRSHSILRSIYQNQACICIDGYDVVFIVYIHPFSLEKAGQTKYYNYLPLQLTVVNYY